MKLHRRKLLNLAAGAAALPAVSKIAKAQAYPSRPVTMIVPASAGGPTDTIGRILAQRMQATLGQNVVIENVTGATGTIGTGRVVRATPDGYTIGLGGWNHYVVNGAVFTLPYHLFDDVAPVALICSGPQLILSKKDIPANNLQELIAWLKARPEGVTFGTGGVGGPGHVSGLAFEKLVGTKFIYVPHRGSAPATQNLVAGQLDISIDQPSGAISQVRGGLIKAYAVTAEARLASAPDIPTTDEAGLPGFHVSIWHGLWVPRATPSDIIAKLNAAVVDALADASVRSKLADIGQGIFPRDQQTSEAHGAFHKAEIEKWWPIIRRQESRWSEPEKISAGVAQCPVRFGSFSTGMRLTARPPRRSCPESGSEVRALAVTRWAFADQRRLPSLGLSQAMTNVHRQAWTQKQTARRSGPFEFGGLSRSPISRDPRSPRSP